MVTACAKFTKFNVFLHKASYLLANPLKTTILSHGSAYKLYLILFKIKGILRTTYVHFMTFCGATQLSSVRVSRKL